MIWADLFFILSKMGNYITRNWHWFHHILWWTQIAYHIVLCLTSNWHWFQHILLTNGLPYCDMPQLGHLSFILVKVVTKNILGTFPKNNVSNNTSKVSLHLTPVNSQPSLKFLERVDSVIYTYFKRDTDRQTDRQTDNLSCILGTQDNYERVSLCHCCK